MAKRKGLGAGVFSAEEIAGQVTGTAPVALAPPALEVVERDEQDGDEPRAATARARRKQAAAEPEPEQCMTTTVRIKLDHWRALHEEALRRAMPGRGRTDASAVLREVLDEWLESRAS